MIQKTYFKTKDYCKVKFSFEAAEAETVEVLGLNNDWETAITLGKKKDGTFSLDVNLPKNSTHEFRYRINQTEWSNDPTADAETTNAFGSTNSVLSL